METRLAPLIELLSLRRESSRYVMEVGVTLGDRHERRIMDLDEFTFRRLQELDPFAKGRVRLSPYRKWDPFKKSFYSTLTATSGSMSETLYFTCSEDYGNQLAQAIERITTELPLPPPARPAGEATARSRASRRGIRTGRGRHRLLRTAVVCLFMLGLFLQMDVERFTRQAEALSQYADAPVTGTGAGDLSPGSGVVQAPAGGTDGTPYANREPMPSAVPAAEPASAAETSEAIALAAPPPPEPQKEAEPPAKAVEVVEIGKEKSYFSLPKGYVALSFDDGPSVYTEKIVDILEEQQVAATFLFIGKNAEKHPDAVVYAGKHGMAVGNHSWDHSKLTERSGKEQRENIRKSNELLESLVGVPVTLFRPPYGAINQELSSSVTDQGMKVLMWNRDPEDWNAKTQEDILRYIHEFDPSGGLYVMHEDKLTVSALPAIIQYFKEKNLQFAIFK